MNYIPADKLIAEIERRIQRCEDCERDGEPDTTSSEATLKSIRSFIASLQQEPRFPQYDNIIDKVFGAGNLEGFEYHEAEMLVALAKEELLKSLQQEQPEVELEKFTEKIKTFQGRYKYPEIISIKGAMGFMARLFYQYPSVARQWYDSLPKATMD